MVIVNNIAGITPHTNTNSVENIGSETLSKPSPLSDRGSVSPRVNLSEKESLKNRMREEKLTQEYLNKMLYSNFIPDRR